MSNEEPECCTIENTKVIDSRQGSDSSIRRRRECLTCSKRFTTYERVEDYELLVLKKNGTIQEFNKTKIIVTSALGVPLGNDPSGYRIIDFKNEKLSYDFYKI